MFNKSNFCHIASNNRNDQKGSVFIYKTTDTLAQVTQSGYFNEKLIDINVHDLIIHVQYDPVARTLKKSVLIVTERTMDNVATQPITDETILNDIGDLGEQVAGIEEKIPENASAQNQLATKNQITDLQNSKQDKATAINYDNITNCITEIPQDIKLEIDSNGYLILKAGSKLYIPNGAGVFDVMTVSSDTRMNTNSTGTLILFCRANAVSAIVSGTEKTSSGETDSLAGETYHTWYDTTNNFIYRYTADATTPAYKLTLPLAIVTMTTGGICTSIDKVFNGFGYIGSTVFALPGVKGLIPNGRNEDGTLKNTTFAVNSVLKITGTGTNKVAIRLKADEIATGDLNYDETNNYNTHLTSGEIRTYAIVGYISRTSGVINSLSTKTAFHAVDYSDTDFIAHQAMPSSRRIDLSASVTDGFILNAPADGYFYLGKYSTNTGQRIKLQNTAIGSAVSSWSSGASQNLECMIFAAKGQNIKTSMTADGNVNGCFFIYSNGAK